MRAKKGRIIIKIICTEHEVITTEFEDEIRASADIYDEIMQKLGIT